MVFTSCILLKQCPVRGFTPMKQCIVISKGVYPPPPLSNDQYGGPPPPPPIKYRSSAEITDKSLEMNVSKIKCEIFQMKGSPSRLNYTSTETLYSPIKR